MFACYSNFPAHRDILFWPCGACMNHWRRCEFTVCSRRPYKAQKRLKNAWCLFVYYSKGHCARAPITALEYCMYGFWLSRLTDNPEVLACCCDVVLLRSVCIWTLSAFRFYSSHWFLLRGRWNHHRLHSMFAALCFLEMNNEFTWASL